MLHVGSIPFAFYVRLRPSTVKVLLDLLHSFYIVVNGLPIGWDIGFVYGKNSSVRLASRMIIEITFRHVYSCKVPLLVIRMIGQRCSNDLSHFAGLVERCRHFDQICNRCGCLPFIHKLFMDMRGEWRQDAKSLVSLIRCLLV